MNLIKEAKDLYPEIYKILMKKKLKTEVNTSRWKDIPCLWVGRINVKMTMLPKAIYKLSAILIKIPMAFLTKLEQIILKLFICKYDRP